MANFMANVKRFLKFKLKDSKYDENEKKRQDLNIMQLTNQAENYKIQYFNVQQEYHKLESSARQFCGNLLGNIHAANQLGGSTNNKMNIYDFMQYTDTCLKKEKERSINLLSDLTSKLNDREKDLGGLQAQLSQFLLREKQLLTNNAVNTANSEIDIINNANTDSNQTAPIVNETITVDEPIIKNSTHAEVEKPKKEKKLNVSTVVIVEDEPNEDVTPETESSTLNENLKKNLNSPESSDTLCQTGNPSVSSKDVGNSDSQKVITHMIDLGVIMSEMDDIMWSIINTIGKFGVVIKDEIKEIVFNDPTVKGKVKNSTYFNALKKLEALNIVNTEKISTHKWYFTYTFTETGIRIYHEKHGEYPVENEKQKLQKDHQNYFHGYYIKDTAEILLNLNKFEYTKVTIDRKTNAIDFHNGTMYYPDIIATNEDGTCDYYEVELGTTTQKDFNEKCDKMRWASNKMFFITPDENTSKQIYEKQIPTWINEKGGKDKLKGTMIYVTSSKKLKETEMKTTWSYYRTLA